MKQQKNFPGHMNYEPRMSWLKIVTQGGEGPKLHYSLLSCMINYSNLGDGGGNGDTKVTCPILTSTKHT